MRLLVRYIISVCLLLWGGHAHTHPTCIDKFPGSNAHTYADTDFSGLHFSNAFIRQAPESGDEPQIRYRLRATLVEEDDESESSRPHTVTASSSLAYLFAKASAGFFDCTKKCLPVCEHFSYYASDKFIIHRVIRI